MTVSATEKLDSIHPGEILKEEFLMPMNISQHRLAKSIGVDSGRIHSIVQGDRDITAETALLLSRYFGNSAEFWIGLQTQYDLETAEDRIAQKLELVKPFFGGVVYIPRPHIFDSIPQFLFAAIAFSVLNSMAKKKR